MNRGVTVAGDSAFYETDHAHLLAFNRFTGELRWDVAIADYKDGYAAVSPPLPVGDLLIAGIAGGEEGVRGFVDAYRQSTGERVWRFWTIPARGARSRNVEGPGPSSMDAVHLAARLLRSHLTWSTGPLAIRALT